VVDRVVGEVTAVEQAAEPSLDATDAEDPRPFAIGFVETHPGFGPDVLPNHVVLFAAVLAGRGVRSAVGARVSAHSQTPLNAERMVDCQVAFCGRAVKQSAQRARRPVETLKVYR
jgi:hypothetical protein